MGGRRRIGSFDGEQAVNTHKLGGEKLERSRIYLFFLKRGNQGILDKVHRKRGKERMSNRKYKVRIK